MHILLYMCIYNHINIHIYIYILECTKQYKTHILYEIRSKMPTIILAICIYIYLISTSLTSQAVPRKGKVCLDGVRFLSTEHTTPVEVCKAVQPKELRNGAKEAAVSSLLQRVSGGQAKRSAAAVKKCETW